MIKSDLSEKFETLLDTEYQHHIIEVMNEWCGDTHGQLNAARADLVDKEISSPLRAWIDEAQSIIKAGNYQDIEASRTFAIKADEIVFILRYNTRPLYPEHVAMLNSAWSEFQREIAHGLHVRNRILKEVIDSQPGKEEVVDEYLKQRDREEATKREAKKQENLKNWQCAGANAARKYTADDKKKWLEAAKKILKENNRIKSIRQLAIEIGKRLGYPPESDGTIRKVESIKKLFREHKLNKNVG